MGRDEHLHPRQPVSRVGDQIADRPERVVEVEIFDLSNLSVEGAKGVILQLFCLVQHVAAHCFLKKTDAIESRGGIQLRRLTL